VGKVGMRAKEGERRGAGFHPEKGQQPEERTGRRQALRRLDDVRWPAAEDIVGRQERSRHRPRATPGTERQVDDGLEQAEQGVRAPGRISQRPDTTSTEKSKGPPHRSGSK